MRFGKVSFTASVLAFSCVTVAGYSFLNDHNQAEVDSPIHSVSYSESAPHQDWINSYLDTESTLYSIDVRQWDQAKKNIQNFYQQMDNRVALPASRNIKEIAEYVQTLDNQIDASFTLSQQPRSFSEALSKQQMTPDMKSWLMLSTLRRAGFSVETLKFHDHFHLVVRSNDDAYEWKDNHVLDMPGDHGVALTDYDLWTEFDIQLSENYMALKLNDNDDAIESILRQAVLTEEHGEAKKLYSHFLVERGRDEEVALLK